MALIKCEECGHDVSDKAVACPHCGAPIGIAVEHERIPDEQTESCEECVFTVEYAKSKSFLGSVQFFFDGEQMYTIKPGDIFEYRTTPGNHKVVIRQGKNTRGMLPLYIDENKDLVVKIFADGHRASFKVTDYAKSVSEGEVSSILQEMNEREKKKEKDKNTGLLLLLVSLFVVFGIIIYSLYTDDNFVDKLNHSINDVFGHTHEVEITLQTEFQTK